MDQPQVFMRAVNEELPKTNRAKTPLRLPQEVDLYR